MLDADESAAAVRSARRHLFNAKQYDQAIAAYQKAHARLTPNNPQAHMLIAQALPRQGNKAEAATASPAGDSGPASGGPEAERGYLQARRRSRHTRRKSPTAIELARDWVAAYPSADSWHNALAIYRNLDHADLDRPLDMMRLLQADQRDADAGRL